MQGASLRRGPLLRQLGLAEGHVLQGDYDAMGELRVPGHPGQPGTGRAWRGAAVCSVPYDGLSLADSPLGYVDKGDDGQEELFLKLQEYLLSEDVQDEIQRTGRRSGYTGVSEKNKDVFRADWACSPTGCSPPSKCQLPMFCLNA